MAEDELKFRISADADQAQRELDETSRRQKELAGVTDRSGDVADRAAQQQRGLSDQTQKLGKRTAQAGDQMSRTSRQARGLTGRLRGLAGSIGSMVSGWLSFAAIGGTIIALYRDIANAANEALEAQEKLGDHLKGLSANIGGGRADQTLKDVNRIASEQKLGVTGREQLISAATTMTDLEGELPRDVLRERLREIGKLQRGTDLSGGSAVETVQALRSNLNLSFEQSTDLAGTMSNQGFDAKTIRDIAERGGSLEGMDLLSLLSAARTEINVGTINEGLQTLRNSLTRRNTDGELVEELQNLGLSGDMGLVEKIATLRSGIRSGEIDQGAIERLGGTRAQATFTALSRALPRLSESREALKSGRIEDEIEKIRESEFVRAAEEQRSRELREKLASEDFGGSDVASGFAEAKTHLREKGGGSIALGLGLEGAGESATAAVHDDDTGERASEMGGGLLSGFSRAAGVTNVTNIGTQINNADDPETAGLGGDR